MSRRPWKGTIGAALGLLCASTGVSAGPSWETPRVPASALAPEGVGSFSAMVCATCHPDIAREWAASTHAHAWIDPQFQAERAKDPAVAWLCDNCHTPLARQQAVLSTPSATGDVRRPTTAANPAFDATLREEGITCLTCHWRPDGIASINPDAQAPHALVYAPELKSEQTCTVCHQAVARVGDTLVCTFDTGEEWRAANPGKTCPECHMPRVTRPMAVGGPVREGGRHLWPGGLMPKRPLSPEEQALFADWKPGARVRLSGPASLEPGGEALVGVYLEHAGAGHRMPTGDPERFLLVVAEAISADGRVLASLRHRAGQTWTWWPVAKKTGDNRLSPGESRVMPLRFTLPDAPSARPVAVRVRLEHHRISAENAAHHNLRPEVYPFHRVVQIETLRVDTTPGAGPPR